MNLWRFTWTTVVGYLPLTVLVTYLGSTARTLSPGNPLIWVAIAAAVLLLGGHRALRRAPAPAPSSELAIVGFHRRALLTVERHRHRRTRALQLRDRGADPRTYVRVIMVGSEPQCPEQLACRLLSDLEEVA